MAKCLSNTEQDFPTKRLKAAHTCSNKVYSYIDVEGLPEFSTSESLLLFISSSKSILGEVAENELNNLSYTSKTYDYQKVHAINRFYAVISRHKSLSKLSDFVIDTEDSNGPKVTRFVSLCRRIKKLAKAKIMTNRRMPSAIVSWRQKRWLKRRKWCIFKIIRLIFNFLRF